MPSLDYALLCEYAKEEGGVAHVIAGGIDSVYVPSTPTVVSVVLLIRVEFTRGEAGRPHRIEVMIQDIDGALIGRVNAVVTPEWTDDQPTGWPLGLMSALNLGLPIPRFGEYSMEILVNDDSQKSLHLRVLPLADSAGDSPPEQ